MKTHRQLANEYWQTSQAIHQRIQQLRQETKVASTKELPDLEQRIQLLQYEYYDLLRVSAHLERYGDCNE